MSAAAAREAQTRHVRRGRGRPCRRGSSGRSTSTSAASSRRRRPRPRPPRWSGARSEQRDRGAPAARRRRAQPRRRRAGGRRCGRWPQRPRRRVPRIRSSNQGADRGDVEAPGRRRGARQRVGQDGVVAHVSRSPGGRRRAQRRRPGARGSAGELVVQRVGDLRRCPLLGQRCGGARPRSVRARAARPRGASGTAPGPGRGCWPGRPVAKS